MLGGIVKDKVRFYQLQKFEQPEKISVQVSELEERVSPVHDVGCDQCGY